MKISERAHQIGAERATKQGQDWFSVEFSDLMLAIDEWQASVEERLMAVRHAAGFDRPSVPISDPGPSKYDAEPESTPE